MRAASLLLIASIPGHMFWLLARIFWSSARTSVVTGTVTRSP